MRIIKDKETEITFLQDGEKISIDELIEKVSGKLLIMNWENSFLVVDESSYDKNKPINPTASIMAQRNILGNAVVVPRNSLVR